MYVWDVFLKFGHIFPDVLVGFFQPTDGQFAPLTNKARFLVIQSHLRAIRRIEKQSNEVE